MHLHRPSNVPTFAVLQDRDFRAIWYVGGLHEISRRMELFVLSWLILQTTNSPFQLGLVMVFNNVPRLIFSLYFGMVTDRFSRWRIMAASQCLNTVMAFVILWLIFSDSIASWQVFTAAFMQGLARSMDDPARRTAILDIVGERRIVNALSLDQISNTMGKLAGPILGGLLLQIWGFTGAYALVVAVHLVTQVMLFWVRVPSFQRLPSQSAPVWRTIAGGLRHASRNRLLLGMLYITIVMNAMAFPLQQFVPAIGRDYLQVSVALIGLLGAAEGVGQLLGAGVMSATRNLTHHGRIFVAGSATVLLMALLFVWSPWYAVSFLLLTVSGIGQSGFATMQSSITMLSAPREMRGQMVGLMSLCIGLGWWLGPLEIGGLAALFSTQWAISFNALTGLLLLLPAVIFTPLVSRPAGQPEPATAQD